MKIIVIHEELLPILRQLLWTSPPPIIFWNNFWLLASTENYSEELVIMDKPFEIFIPCNVLHYFTYSEISFPFFFNRLKMQKPSSSQFWKQVIDQLQAVVWRLLFLRANFSSKFQKIFDKFCQCSTTGNFSALDRATGLFISPLPGLNSSPGCIRFLLWVLSQS